MAHRFPGISVPVHLRSLFPQASFVGCADIQVTEATERSNECGPHVLFAALPGTRVDGADFAGEAIAQGADALLVERPLPDASVPQCVVPDVRRAYAELCAALQGRPSRDLQLVGVTGTNGKTTVTWMIRSILQAANHQTGLLGTIEASDGRHTEPAGLTTPDSKCLSRWLSRMVEHGTTHAALELSSHALAQHRSVGTELDVAIVTNVTHDHFDYHRDYPHYLDSKGRILEHCQPGGLAVLNADDTGSSSLTERLTQKSHAAVSLCTYGLEHPADVTAVIREESLAGSRFLLSIDGESIEVASQLVGRHNVSNALAAAAAAAHMGVPLETIQTGLQSLQPIPGRLERIDGGQPFDIFVDYAHTPDALARQVDALQELASGRLICVFGAGGDRDRTKRPALGRAAGRADLAVVTSDNPRTENPDGIIRDILGGMQSVRSQSVHVEPDRAEAIRWALRHASAGDCVLIAGKGHETSQEIGTRQIVFDDRDVVRQILAEEKPAGTGSPNVSRIGA